MSHFDAVSPLLNNDAARGASTHIAQAARATGADFDYLLQTAARESAFDARAEASTSSAAGLFQFIEQTWLGVMQRHGADHGYAHLAGQIEGDGNGRFSVADADSRQAILDLRFDPRAASLMAAELTAENGAVIENRLGRPASTGELYAAHFLGASGAASLIEAAEARPDQRADQLFPQAARANRAIFFEGGRPRTAAEVLSVLTGQGEAVRRAAPEPGETAPSAPHVGAAPRAFSAGLHAASFTAGRGELSPTVVEILASLDAPARGRDREGE